MRQSILGQTSRNKVALYASVGPELTQYDVDIDGATRHRLYTVILPANVHCVWPHASGRHLYVATSKQRLREGPGRRQAPCDRVPHRFRLRGINPARRSDPAANLPYPYDDRHSLRASAGRVQQSERLRLYRINADMTPGTEVAQPEPIDPSIYARRSA